LVQQRILFHAKSQSFLYVLCEKLCALCGKKNKPQRTRRNTPQSAQRIFLSVLVLIFAMREK